MFKTLATQIYYFSANCIIAKKLQPLVHNWTEAGLQLLRTLFLVGSNVYINYWFERPVHGSMGIYCITINQLKSICTRFGGQKNWKSGSEIQFVRSVFSFCSVISSKKISFSSVWVAKHNHFQFQFSWTYKIEFQVWGSRKLIQFHVPDNNYFDVILKAFLLS